jgi:hypothetical protein
MNNPSSSTTRQPTPFIARAADPTQTRELLGEAICSDVRSIEFVCVNRPDHAPYFQVAAIRAGGVQGVVTINLNAIGELRRACDAFEEKARAVIKARPTRGRLPAPARAPGIPRGTTQPR